MLPSLHSFASFRLDFLNFFTFIFLRNQESVEIHASIQFTMFNQKSAITCLYNI